MTNFEYIIQNMTERDMADCLDAAGCFNSVGFPNGDIFRKAVKAFEKHRKNLGLLSMYYHIDNRKKQPNCFTCDYFEFVKRDKTRENELVSVGDSTNANYAMPRERQLSIQVWLSKQYKSEEWDITDS